jgi:hypothetical protein
MNLLHFCIAFCAIVYTSLAAENLEDDQNMEFALCPESHPHAIARGKVSLIVIKHFSLYQLY